MPWFPIKGVVRKLRMERKWSRHELAKKSGIKQRTIRLWESDLTCPRKGQDDTVRGLASAFGVPPETLANWFDYDPAISDEAEDTVDAPTISTLGVRAARDDLREWIKTPAGDAFEMMRPRLLHQLSTAAGLFADRKYAITGKVRDHRSMPSIVGSILRLDPKVCGQFYFLRKTPNGDPMYASPFTSCAEQTRQLFDAAETKRPVTLIVRIEIREPTETKDFRGFFFFQKKKEKPKAWNWCFVVDQVVDGEISVHYGEPSAAGKIENASKVVAPAKLPRPSVVRTQAAE
ncbi:MAG TPA: helix-turn-helix transcriptional regulator [Candidatus Acidoferrales bacterium]|nr:helix-turn-helix transcriptional regulator [Candidatus Acidoferrales bacterium]